MTDKKVNTVPPQGDRTPRGRREGDIVPVSLPSSSSNGQVLSATVKRRLRRKRKRKRELEEEEEEVEKEEPTEEKPPFVLESREDGILFEDGTLVPIESSLVSSIFQRVFLDMKGQEQLTPAKKKYLFRCLGSLDWETVRREYKWAMLAFRHQAAEDGSKKWQAALAFAEAAAWELEKRLSSSKENLEIALAVAREEISLLRAAGKASKKELEELRGRTSARPPPSTKEMGIQMSLPFREEEDIRKELEEMRGRALARPPPSKEVEAQVSLPLRGEEDMRRELEELRGRTMDRPLSRDVGTQASPLRWRGKRRIGRWSLPWGASSPGYSPGWTPSKGD